MAPPVMPNPDGSPVAGDARKILTATYYDTTNFARRIKVPGYYNWGYNDEVCPHRGLCGV